MKSGQRSKIAILFFSFAILGFMAACQSKPTQVFQSLEPKIKDSKTPIKLADLPKETVVVDARPAFDYALSHINGSVNIRWDEFTQQEEAFKGLLEADLYFHARRLARLGIGLETPVIVVGRGPQGAGEEGRVAWTLRYLGLKNVSFMHIDSFDRPNTREEAPPRLAQPIWKPEIQESLNAERSDVLKKAMAPRTADQSFVLIDVRPSAEYLGKVKSALGAPPPDLGAINIPWTEFITSKGTTNLEIKERLQNVGVTPEKQIIVLSHRGVESATVALVLRELGYEKAANYSGGFADLMAEPQRVNDKSSSKSSLKKKPSKK